MDKSELTVLDSRSALVRALHFLRYLPPEKIADVYEAAYGHRIENACAAIHAGVYEKMFKILLNDFDERYKLQLIQRQAELDSSIEGTALPGGSQHMQKNHL